MRRLFLAIALAAATPSYAAYEKIPAEVSALRPVENLSRELSSPGFALVPTRPLISADALRELTETLSREVGRDAFTFPRLGIKSGYIYQRPPVQPRPSFDASGWHTAPVFAPLKAWAEHLTELANAALPAEERVVLERVQVRYDRGDGRSAVGAHQDGGYLRATMSPHQGTYALAPEGWRQSSPGDTLLFTASDRDEVLAGGVPATTHASPPIAGPRVLGVITWNLEGFHPNEVAFANAARPPPSEKRIDALPYLEKAARAGQSMLDFGAGPDAPAVRRLASRGLDVVAYDFGANVRSGIHDADALSRRYDWVLAWDVLGGQASLRALSATMRQLGLSVRPGGSLLVNFPARSSLRYSAGGKAIGPKEIKSRLSEYFRKVRLLEKTTEESLFLASEPKH